MPPRVTAPVTPLAGSVASSADYGYVLSPNNNASARAVNALLAEGACRALAWAKLKESTRRGSIIIKRERCATGAIAVAGRFARIDLCRAASRPRVLRSTRCNVPVSGYTSRGVANNGRGVDALAARSVRPSTTTPCTTQTSAPAICRSYHAIILPDQSPYRLLHGHNLSAMPEPYTGGLGLEGALALETYVKGGRHPDCL